MEKEEAINPSGTDILNTIEENDSSPSLLNYEGDDFESMSRLIPVSDHQIDETEQGQTFIDPNYPHPKWYAQNQQVSTESPLFPSTRPQYQPFYPTYDIPVVYPQPFKSTVLPRHDQLKLATPFIHNSSQKASSHSHNSNSDGSYHHSPGRAQPPSSKYYYADGYNPQGYPEPYYYPYDGGATADDDYGYEGGYANFPYYYNGQIQNSELYEAESSSKNSGGFSGKNLNKTNIEKYRALLDENSSYVLIVKGLEGPGINSEIINSLFSNFGNVNRVLFIRSKATAYIEYPTNELSSIAKQMLNGLSFFGKPLLVGFCNLR